MTERIETSIIQIKPTFIGQKCPVCNGWGTVSFRKLTCHACKGTGYILIPLEREKDRYEIPKL